MKLTILSDTHNKHAQVKIPKCDILLHCGDFSAMGRGKEVKSFLRWFDKQPAKHKVYIAGNHDLSYERHSGFKQVMQVMFPGLIYLENNSVELEGLKIWGSPYTPEFFNWAFLYARNSKAAEDIYSTIPEDVDILMTHGPPKNVLDKCARGHAIYPNNAGCEILRRKIEEMQPRYSFSGHIHEQSSPNPVYLGKTACYNVSICDFGYQPNNLPLVLDI